MTVDGLTARIEAQMAEARDRASRLRAAVPMLALELRLRGATKVVLVGSLARGDEPNLGTDVDLIVTGLSLGNAYEAGCDLSVKVDGPVEVIPEDIVGPRLRHAVETEGIDVTDRADDVAG